MGFIFVSHNQKFEACDCWFWVVQPKDARAEVSQIPLGIYSLIDAKWLLHRGHHTAKESDRGDGGAHAREATFDKSPQQLTGD